MLSDVNLRPYTEGHRLVAAGEKADASYVADTAEHGGTVQARPRLESARFQKFNLNEEKTCFQLEPCLLACAPTAWGRRRRGDLGVERLGRRLRVPIRAGRQRRGGAREDDGGEGQ